MSYIRDNIIIEDTYDGVDKLLHWHKAKNKLIIRFIDPGSIPVFSIHLILRHKLDFSGTFDCSEHVQFLAHIRLFSKLFFQ